MFTIVCYDTPSDRRRRRLARALADFVCRVQKSVFEGHLPLGRQQGLMDRIRAVVDTSEDSVRVYRLPADALASVDVLGAPPLNRPSAMLHVGEEIESEEGAA